MIWQNYLIKKIFILSTVLCSLLFLSCSNGNSTPFLFNPEDSLRAKSTMHASNVTWTAEKEFFMDELSVPQDDNALSQGEDVFFDQAALPLEFLGDSQSLFLNRVEFYPPIYPELEGFGSLNTSILPPMLVSLVDDFLKSVQTSDIGTSFFPDDKSYLKILIDYDFNFLPKLKTWILGEPFLLTSDTHLVFEIPIRLVFDTGFSDIFIYCADFDGRFKIEQFSIGELQNE